MKLRSFTVKPLVKTFLVIASCTMALIWTCSLANAAETIESALLYCIDESEGVKTLRYDGYKSAPIADDVKVADTMGGELRDLSTLRQAIGVEPDWTTIKIGETIGKELNDALYARLTLEEGRVVSIMATRRVARPCVGIAWYRDDVEGRYIKLADAILRNGARATLLPVITDDASCDEALKRIDGIVLPGGADIDPAYYNEKAYPHGSVGIQPIRDTSDYLATRGAIARNIPGLWICRGEQMLNVALGGALIQDIPSFQGHRTLNGEIDLKETTVLPDDGAPKSYGRNAETTECMPAHFRVQVKGVDHSQGRHGFTVDKESVFLKRIIGDGDFPAPISSHHQGADPTRLGEGLRVVAIADDGIVEAIEYQDNDFALGIQFHPESDAFSEDDRRAAFSRAFFLELIDFSRDYATKRTNAKAL